MNFKKLLSLLFIIVLLSVVGLKYSNMNINDIGLKVLSWVKKVGGGAVDLDAINKDAASTIAHDQWTTLLTKHVSEEGKVNYKGFLDDQAEFQLYLDALSNNPPANNWSENEQMAYWINAYNAFTVKLIIDNYPLESIKDISSGIAMINSPWDIKFFKIGDTEFDLNTIEHEILRKDYNEPRIHFAVNCASYSCPKLRNSAFTAEALDAQLDVQAKGFLSNPAKNIITEHETKLSKIFDWFESDFTKERTLFDFISSYKSSIRESNEVEFIAYDWSLNE